MKIQILRTVCVAGLIAASSTTLADPEVDSFYLGLLLGFGKANYGVSDFQGLHPSMQMATVNGGGSFAAAFLAGYQFLENWAVEAGFVQFPSTNFTNIMTSSGALFPGYAKENAIFLDLKGIWPLDNGINIFAKGGFGEAHSYTTKGMSIYGQETKFVFLLGAGASYVFTPNWTVDLSFTNFFRTGRIPNASIAAIGIYYYFI